MKNETLSKEKMTTNIIFFGHFAIDTIIRFKEKRNPSLGGSVSFGSLALRRYTKKVDVGIISNIGIENFDTRLLNPLKKRDIDLSIKKFKTLNTNFILNYKNHSRSLILKSKSPNLEINDIPSKLSEKPPDIIVLVPLCNEITIDYIKEIIRIFPEAYIGIDLQGFLRRIDPENGQVSYLFDEKLLSNVKNMINIIGDKLILKGSEVEMKLLSEKEDLMEVMEFFNEFDNKAIYIMTLGEAGSMITKKGEKLLKIPAFTPNTVVDETGAGDVYLAIFLYEFYNSDFSWKAVENAALYASSAASFLVEKKGTNGSESKKKVYKRSCQKNYIKEYR
ncbi:MAG: PfkB family carbohydrate kinase [Promethearchaeota archaeon]